ncbi:hypothetical protein MycrhDRAFT_4177 [Mycolicibacterium rhodesiae JS60]|nr:hypothetical protein MycrhDRAFT_4177 [Mycolicibacterium rhodesiae JS60]
MTAPSTTSPEAFLRPAAWAFLAGWGLHVIDHLRRGMSASPMFIMAGGTVQGVIVVTALGEIGTGLRLLHAQRLGT